ncbi:CDP-alcohol phosphatidyltransferase family protein [Specibacter sp. NPDC057265]|uniref:CDP-alcohol phosphatidyltransferase family protein n=1 Tax=Specibacter sp. NPDC057265 TaxID=3346075 RepID=UPI00363B06EE
MTQQQKTAAHSAAPGPRTRGSFGEILAGLKFAQKSGVGVPAYTRWVNRGLARGVAAFFAARGWSANAVSGVSAVFSFAALALLLLLPVSPLTGLLVAVLLAAGYVLDSADGQVARVTGTGSMAGEWLDHVIDAARTPAIHLCVAAGFVGLYGAGAWQWWLPLLYCAVATCHFMSQILAEQLLRNAAPAPQPVPAPTAPVPSSGAARSLLMVHTDSGTLCWLFVAWGFPPLFLLLYVVMLAANTVTAAASIARKFRSLQGAQAVAA